MESDVQQVSKVNKDFDFGEGCTSEQHLSKIPRPSKSGSPKKKLIKDLERPSSAKSIVTLENKYRASMVKYNKELKEMQTQTDKLNLLRDTMTKLIYEMQEKGQKDIPSIPDTPSMLSIPAFISSRSPSFNLSLKKKTKLDVSPVRSNEFVDELKGNCHLDADTLELIKAEMPNLEKTLNILEDALNSAHEKQSNLENKLDNYKDDITIIMNDFENVASIRRNSELLIKELENIKDEFQKERNQYRKEMEVKDEELRRLRGNLETEFSKRKSLEDAHAKTQHERDQVKEDCEDYIKQIEKIQKMQTLTPNTIGGPQDLAIQNGQLQYEVDDLKTKLSMSQRKLASLTEENDKHKQEIRKLVVEREEIKNEFVNHCQQILFEKENQIYSIKSKMDSIVNLKNTMVSREGRGEPFFSIDLIMNINDANALKKEVVGLHKRLISFEETRTDLERSLSIKDVKIQGLEEELVTRTQALDRMENLVDIMKRKDRENNEILACLDLSTELFSEQQLVEEDDKEEKLKELVRWQEKQREMVAELEKELKTSEERYSLSEERRIRNEERIAMLQHKLAKYQYFR